jgi:hypothetical protein
MRKLNRLHFLPGLLLLLALGWPAIPAAQASDTGAASTTGTPSITVVAPGAAIGQAVEVQWGDPLGGVHVSRRQLDWREPNFNMPALGQLNLYMSMAVN